MSSETSTTWYVKSNESFRGPFSPQELIRQSCTGVLVGDSELSASQEGPWLKAENLETLEMEWQVQPEGTDPLPRCHALALRNWVEDEKVQPFWDILHVPSGETYDVVDALCSALLAQNHLLEDRVSALSQQAQPLNPSSDTPQNQQEKLIQSDQAKKEASKWKGLYDDEIKRNETREHDLLEQNEELRAWQRKASERIKALERRQVTYDETRQQAENLGDLSGDRDLSQAYQELHLQMTHLMDSLQLKSRQLDESREQAKEMKLHLRQERKIAEEKVDQVSQLHEDTLDQLNLMEQGHIQLTRSYRELNDRLIQLRNEVPKEESATIKPIAAASKPSKKASKASASAPDKPAGGTVKIKMT